MAGITLAQAESQLALYLAAEAAVLAGQSYQLGDRTLTRADLAAIQIGIETWQGRIDKLASTAAAAKFSGLRVSGITPG